MTTLSQEMILSWLEDVKDPEIPVLSLVDLGVIRGIDIAGNHVSIALTPTFVGCPALDMMKDEITSNLKGHGVEDVKISVTFREPWTSDMISEKGKIALKKFGLAPPPSQGLIDDIDVLEHAICPRCNGTHTELKNTFGPTLCRSIHYCLDCREAFEQFKPI
ncbi:1,2-phenylacetyl-CoA epoxidase subunit PaaD [Pseudochryseolinea flava]|uniref:Phenylacetate-CoA oxygenase subunit PaaJ n=1 Tax=Pseudochryseolinea flava TaxID=2059302 RepID=A0A364XVH4_9BACT|nr:1,2-phenylacetyl-CoA epoxidase subunit PaaD [Pseudochryseolinea flava]RAV98310.1 phenylacetate-CoA oxygenase subunit PaaJ [Pseudochryseolinea flava]